MSGQGAVGASLAVWHVGAMEQLRRWFTSSTRRGKQCLVVTLHAVGKASRGQQLPLDVSSAGQGNTQQLKQRMLDAFLVCCLTSKQPSAENYADFSKRISVSGYRVQGLGFDLKGLVFWFKNEVALIYIYIYNIKCINLLVLGSTRGSLQTQLTVGGKHCHPKSQSAEITTGCSLQ